MVILSGARCSFAPSLAPVNPDWFYLPGFTFLVPAHPGSPGHSPRGRKMVVVVAVVVVVVVVVQFTCQPDETFYRTKERCSHLEQ